MLGPGIGSGFQPSIFLVPVTQGYALGRYRMRLWRFFVVAGEGLPHRAAIATRKKDHLRDVEKGYCHAQRRIIYLT